MQISPISRRARRAIRRQAAALHPKPLHAVRAAQLDTLEAAGDLVDGALLNDVVASYYDALEEVSTSTATDSLVEGFRRLNEQDYAGLSLKDRALLWSALCELKVRFPAASKTADAWSESSGTDEDMEGPAYGRVFLAAAGF